MRRVPTIPPDLAGYDYLSVLGAGGFSDVFLYDQKLPRRKVAVKVLLTDELTESSRSAFVAEANLMAQLSAHPYIVTIFHAGVAPDDRPYFVMEYCAGPSMADRYKREPFAVAEALRTGIRISSAVATAHAAGILHRDIKPGNVLTNDYGSPLLTDFGISSSLEEELPTHTSTIGGGAADTAGGTESQSVGMSVPWSPPEMFEDDPQPDVRSDIFSLAATIHTLLAARTPFEIQGRSNGTLDLIGRIERGVITPIGRDDIPRSLAAVLQKGMAPRREDRFATAVDFARALQRVELELGYAPTPIEVPNLDVPDYTKTVDADGSDETRVRSVATVEAQTPRAAAPAPAAPADETVVRGVTVIPPAAEAPRAPVAVEEGTIVRPRPVAPMDPVPEVAPERRSRRGLVIGVVSTVALVLIAAAVTAGIVFAPKSSTALESPSPTGGSAIVAGGIPQPTDLVGAPSADGSTIVFTWKNPDPQDTDSYYWARSEDPENRTPTAAPTASVPATGARVCIDVYVLREGKTADPVTGCYPQ